MDLYSHPWKDSDSMIFQVTVPKTDNLSNLYISPANLLNEKQMADAIITYYLMMEPCATLTIIYFR